MSDNFSNTVAAIEAKARFLALKARELDSQRREALQRIARLEEVTAHRQRRIAQLEREVEYLRTAMTLTPSRQEVEETRATIAHLLRDIDKCILDLTGNLTPPAVEPTDTLEMQ